MAGEGSSAGPVADVVVVGGGPAGALAAITLAGRGIRALLLDRGRFPRDKPCGGGIRFGVFARFPELSGYLRSTVAIHEIRKVVMESPSGDRVVAVLEDPLYVTLRRTELDAALLARARESGAAVVEGARVAGAEWNGDGVRLRTIDGRVFTGRMVVAADGVNSVVARAAGLSDGFAEDTLAIDTTEETPLAELTVADPEAMYVAYGYKGWAGYGYVFPKRHHVDAGVGFLVSFFKARLAGAPYEHHRRFLEEAAGAGVVRGRSNRDNFKAYRLPLGGPLPRTYGDRVLVCGDAGGFVNAYTGEGIYYAMATGQHAGRAAADALAAGTPSAAALAPYETAWRAEIGDELADSVRIQRRLFANPTLADAVIRAAAMDPKLCRLFARVALGEEPLRRRRREMAWRFLLAGARRRLRRLTGRG
jgi:geranylgeranyl reductase family protein